MRVVYRQSQQDDEEDAGSDGDHASDVGCNIIDDDGSLSPQAKKDLYLKDGMSSEWDACDELGDAFQDYVPVEIQVHGQSELGCGIHLNRPRDRLGK